ncbi:MAG: RluA family pseudouridine synthase [bacterium]
MRLDTFLSTRLPLSRTRIQKLIKEGRVSVNGATEKSSHRVSAGDRICIELPEPQKPSVEAEEIPLRILYEDKDVIVIDKPAGLTVHPAGGKISGTLVNALLYHCRDLSGIGGMARPGIVHRLDKDTSGVMVVAKNDGTHMALSKQIKDRSVEKRYIAVVCGNLKEDRGTIDAPIGRHPKDRKRMAVVGSGGRPARTEFEVKERFSGYTLLDLKPHTGRTHQIRVHLKHIGHPVVGDTAYGFRKREKLPIGRQALHAYLLGFIHPSTGKYVEFRADPPPDIAELIKHLRSKSSPHLRKQKERGDRDA